MMELAEDCWVRVTTICHARELRAGIATSTRIHVTAAEGGEPQDLQRRRRRGWRRGRRMMELEVKGKKEQEEEGERRQW